MVYSYISRGAYRVDGLTITLTRNRMNVYFIYLNADRWLHTARLLTFGDCILYILLKFEVDIWLTIP